MAYANDAVFKDEFWNVFDKPNDQWELVNISMARKGGGRRKQQHLVSDRLRDSSIQEQLHRCGHIHGHPNAGNDQAEGQEPPHRC